MKPLNSVAGTIIGGVVLAVIIVLATMGDHIVGAVPANSVIIWLHVLSGITWIGLLYYFNFVQVPALADAAADDGGPGGAGITKYVAPRALLWFRWTALVTWLTGAAFLLHRGQLDDAFALGMLANSGNPPYELWTTRVSNPVCSPRFRASASGQAQRLAFAIGVPFDLYAFHRSTKGSSRLYLPQEWGFAQPFLG